MGGVGDGRRIGEKKMFWIVSKNHQRLGWERKENGKKTHNGEADHYSSAAQVMTLGHILCYLWVCLTLSEERKKRLCLPWSLSNWRCLCSRSGVTPAWHLHFKMNKHACDWKFQCRQKGRRLCQPSKRELNSILYWHSWLLVFLLVCKYYNNVVHASHCEWSSLAS